jgi:hypothetical protein
MRSDLAPTLSSVRLDSRYPHRQLRVQRKLSRGPAPTSDPAKDHRESITPEFPLY